MPEDAELKTLTTLLELLRPFPQDTRARMWRWVTTRLDADRQADELLHGQEGRR